MSNWWIYLSFHEPSLSSASLILGRIKDIARRFDQLPTPLETLRPVSSIPNLPKYLHPLTSRPQ
jgi:hypothetical protein